MPKTIYSVLEKEHQHVSDLMKHLEEAGPEERPDLLQELRTELLAHADAESATFYDTLQQFSEAEERVQQSEREHEEVRSLLEEIDDAQGDGEAFRSKLARLQEAVGHHVQEEETALFAQARDLISDEEAQDLAEEFLEEKATRVG